jgi:hypothetical protein
VTETNVFALSANVRFRRSSQGEPLSAREAQRVLASRADKLIVAEPGPRRHSPGELLTTGEKPSVLQKTIIRLGSGRENGGNYLLRPVICAIELPRLSAIRTRWEIVRASIFCMTAAL